MQATEREKALKAYLRPRADAWFYASAAMLVVTLVFMLWLVPHLLGIIYLILLAVSIRFLARTVSAVSRFQRGWKALEQSNGTQPLAAEFEAAEKEADDALRFGEAHLFVRAGGMPPRYGEIVRAVRRGKGENRRPLRAQLSDGRIIPLVRPTADAAGNALTARLTDRLMQCNPNMETHPAEQPPIIEAKEFEV